MNNEIVIKRAVLHVLDNNSSLPVISKGELEITEELADYLTKHMDKTLDDPDTKKAEFKGEDNNALFLCKMLSDNEADFLPISVDIANKLFKIMRKNVDIPSADLVCCLFYERGQLCMGILKMNYKAGFTHWVQNSEEGSMNTIIRYQTLLPQDGQKLEECVLINLSDYSIRLLEKQYDINGEKEFYISKYLLNCSCELSHNAKVKIIDKVAKNINKKYFEEDFEKAIEVKKAVSQSLEESDSIRIDKVAGIFNADIRNEYIEEISKAGLLEKEISIPEKLIEKKYKTHKIKTDTGIEINFPIEYAGKNDKIEFINNPDGTISIIIRNIGKIENK
jgi:hypothetical protein